MDENEFLAERFEAKRTHLRAVAFRMLGSLEEADDAVQEAWLRLSRSDTSGVKTWTDGSRPSSHGCAWICSARESHGARNRSVRMRPSRSRAARTGPTPSTKRCWPTRSVSHCS